MAVKFCQIKIPFIQSFLISSWQGYYQSILANKREREKVNSLLLPALPVTCM